MCSYVRYNRSKDTPAPHTTDKTMYSSVISRKSEESEDAYNEVLFKKRKKREIIFLSDQWFQCTIIMKLLQSRDFL